MLKISFDNIYKHKLSENHRFPMIKYELIPEQLIREGTCTDENFFSPSIISEIDVLKVHTNEYYQNLINQNISKKEVRAIGFPMSEKLVERERKIMQGTKECSIYALEYGVSMNIAGGTHHAFSNRGEAFCLLNDQAISAMFLKSNNLANKIMIIDLDVHQGNGTAEIFKNINSVFTVSFHGENNYPFRKEKSDFDYGFKDKTDDKEYLKQIKYHIPRLIEEFNPDYIFYLSGVDILENDKLGRLSVSIKGCMERDNFILNLCKNNNIPVQVSMGGGYSTNLNEIVEAHSNTFRLAQKIFF